MDLGKGIPRDAGHAREKVEIVHHTISTCASSTVGGPWNEESLWNRAGKLEMSNPALARLNSSHEVGVYSFFRSVAPRWYIFGSSLIRK